MVGMLLHDMAGHFCTSAFLLHRLEAALNGPWLLTAKHLNFRSMILIVLYRLSSSSMSMHVGECTECFPPHQQAL
jgi:hypothetical protein